MDHRPQLEQKDVNPGHNSTATDADTETTVKVTNEAGIETRLKDSEKIGKIQSEGCASVSTSHRSANISESKFTRRHGHDNICGTVDSQGSNISSLKPSTDASVSDLSNYRKKTDKNQAADSRRHGQDSICGSVNSPGSNISSSLEASRDADVLGLSKYRKKTDNNPAHKRTKSEICNKRGKDLSINSEQKDRNYDKATDINTSETPLDLRAFGSINRKTQNTEQSLSNNHENPIGKNTLLTPGQNTASNIGITEISRNIAPSEISDSGSKRRSVWSVDNILSDPGPSGLGTINNPKQLCRQPCHQSETPSVNCEEKKGFSCRVCKAEIAKHATEKNIFKCCVCLFENCKEAILHMHSFTHVPKRICNACGKEHAEGNLHDSEHTCVVCPEKFQCRTRLYEHFLFHREYLKNYCWVCNRAFNRHSTEEDGGSSLLCCVCGSHKSTSSLNLAIHYALHPPKLFCKLCKEEYLQEENSLHDRKSKCIKCSQEFGCITQLEDHYKEHDDHFSKHCRLCNELINKHRIKHEGKCFLQCCDDKCRKRFEVRTFRNHLYSHGLRAFKCDACGRRFRNRRGTHNVACKALSYECDICETRFHSVDSLHAHCLVKHSHT